MSFASGAVAFQRFFIDGSFPDHIDDQFVRRLAERSFGRVATLPDNTQLGWIGPHHLFETDLTAERIAFGRFAHFALRIDSAKIPAAVLKGYIQIEEETARLASGREFLSRGERKAAKQTAVLRAEQELKDGAFRKMSSYPVLVDLEAKVVYLGAPSIAVGDQLAKLFSDTFGRALTPCDAGRVALRLMSAAGKSRALENLQPSRFAPSPDEEREAELDRPGAELAFLGSEFLLWLWRRTEDERVEERGPLRIHGGDALVVGFEKSLKLRCAFGITGQTTIASEAPLRMPEARAALRIGKLPIRAGLVLGSPIGEFRLALDPERLTVSGLILPTPEQQTDDPRAMLDQRFEQISDAAELIEGLYETFLHERLDRGWSTTVRRISGWVQGRTETELTGASLPA